MKATGIVRRIDDLGRVVIPKEIRRTMRICEGDPLEIYTEKDGEVIFKKYSPMGELADFAASICESLHKTTGAIAAVADRDSIIAVSGAPRRDMADKRISAQLEQVMEARRAVQFEKTGTIAIMEDNDKYLAAVCAPILAEGDVLGCVIFAGTEDNLPAGDVELKLAQTVSGFLGHQMES